jgi:hypothetical protein
MLKVMMKQMLGGHLPETHDIIMVGAAEGASDFMTACLSLALLSPTAAPKCAPIRITGDD